MLSLFFFGVNFCLRGVKDPLGEPWTYGTGIMASVGKNCALFYLESKIFTFFDKLEARTMVQLENGERYNVFHSSAS